MFLVSLGCEHLKKKMRGGSGQLRGVVYLAFGYLGEPRSPWAKCLDRKEETLSWGPSTGPCSCRSCRVGGWPPLSSFTLHLLPKGCCWPAISMTTLLLCCPPCSHPPLVTWMLCIVAFFFLQGSGIIDVYFLVNQRGREERNGTPYDSDITPRSFLSFFG